jgi:hypothetical protein
MHQCNHQFDFANDRLGIVSAPNVVNAPRGRLHGRRTLTLLRQQRVALSGQSGRALFCPLLGGLADIVFTLRTISHNAHDRLPVMLTGGRFIMGILNRTARGAVAILFAATLAACGNSEADQRKAFISFLQDINGRSGVHFLVPTSTDEKAFGPYLQHYTIILDYNEDMKGPTNDFTAQIMKLGYGTASNSHTIEQMAAAPQDLVLAKDAVDKMEHGIKTRLAKVNADRSALKQPDDLKAVYDMTFDKLVTAPTLAMEKSAKALDVGIDASIKLAEYINSHSDKLAVSGMQIQAKDQRTLDELKPLLKAHHDAGERFLAAQREVQ